MWSTVWFSFTFFELYAYFMIYSFLGWAMESTYVSINAKKWVNRGFINGPFCPIYGTGALLILLALKPVSDSILLLFLGGFVIATVVEYLIGLILEKLFHATWWDYSQKPFNIKGRVCLERSVEWGVLTAFVMRVVQPVIADFVAAIPRAWGEFAATLLLAYLAVDTTIRKSSRERGFMLPDRKSLRVSRACLLRNFCVNLRNAWQRKMKGWSSCARRNVCGGSWFRRKSRKNWNPVSMLCRRAALSSAV